jgi:hypothetical protein
MPSAADPLGTRPRSTVRSSTGDGAIFPTSWPGSGRLTSNTGPGLRALPEAHPFLIGIASESASPGKKPVEVCGALFGTDFLNRRSGGDIMDEIELTGIE